MRLNGVDDGGREGIREVGGRGVGAGGVRRGDGGLDGGAGIWDAGWGFAAGAGGRGGAPAAEAPAESEAGEPAAGAEGDEASGEESEESGEGSAFVPPSWAPRGYADWGNEDPGYWRERFAKEAESQVKFTGRIGQMGDQLRRLSERNAALERELRESKEAAAASEPDLRELPGVKALRESDEVAGKALDEVISGLEGRSEVCGGAGGGGGGRGPGGGGSVFGWDSPGCLHEGFGGSAAWGWGAGVVEGVWGVDCGAFGDGGWGFGAFLGCAGWGFGLASVFA